MNVLVISFATHSAYVFESFPPPPPPTTHHPQGGTEFARCRAEGVLANLLSDKTQVCTFPKSFVTTFPFLTASAVVVRHRTTQGALPRWAAHRWHGPEEDAEAAAAAVPDATGMGLFVSRTQL